MTYIVRTYRVDTGEHVAHLDRAMELEAADLGKTHNGRTIEYHVA